MHDQLAVSFDIEQKNLTERYTKEVANRALRGIGACHFGTAANMLRPLAGIDDKVKVGARSA